MAKIVLGMGASHGPLLANPPEQWDQRVEADRRNPALVYRDGTFKFEELAKLRAGENLEEQIKLPVKQKRYDACQRAMAEMARVFKQAQPDVAVLVGNDQMEVFEDANIPAFMVCFGESVDNIPFSEEQKKKLPPGIEIAEPNHHGKTVQTYPGHPKLGRFLIEKLVQRDFDVAASARLPQSASSNISGLPHAYGFIYRRIMQENFVRRCRSSSTRFTRPTSPACGAVSPSARHWPMRLHPGTRTSASPSSARAGCRILWSTRNSTAAFSMPCNARMPTP